MGNAYANIRGPFTLSVEAPQDKRQAIQTIADLAMARDVRYCRGAVMPKPVSEWSCQGNTCRRTYECGRIHAEFNRLSETRRLVAQTKTYPYQGPRPQLTVEPPPPAPPKQLARSTPEVTAPRLPPRPVVAEVVPKATGLEQRAPEVRPRPERKELDNPVVQRRSNLVRGEMDLVREDFDEEDQDLMAMLQERPQNRTSPFSDEVLERFSWANFAVAINQVSNDRGGSLSTIHGAWTPHYQFSYSAFSLRAHLGGHLFETSFGLEPEQFLVVETLALGQYRVNDYFLAELGGGQQYWNVDGGSSFFTYSLGGYLSRSKPWLGFIDRLGIQYQGVATEDSGREIRLTLGLRF